MAIDFRCTGCGRQLRVGDDAVGRQAKCPHCGSVMAVPEILTAEAAPSPPQAAYAPSPGAYQHVPTYVPNYLAQAILCTLFCCLPFGIVAIVYAAQVNGKLYAGDLEGATAASNSARTWCWAAFACGIIVVVLQILLFVFLSSARVALR